MKARKYILNPAFQSKYSKQVQHQLSQFKPTNAHNFIKITMTLLNIKSYTHMFYTMVYFLMIGAIRSELRSSWCFVMSL